MSLNRATRRLVSSAMAFALVALVCLAARADEVIQDRWDLMRMAGSDAGWVHTTVRKTSDAKGPLYESKVEMKLALKRLGSGVEIEQSATTLERESGEIVSIHSVQKMSDTPKTTDVTFEGGKAKIVTETGKKYETTVPCPPDAVGPWKIERLAIEKGMKPGTTYDAKTFSPDVSGAAVMHVVVIGPEETELLDGQKETLTKMETSLDVLPMFKTSEWVGADGTPKKTSVPMMGMKIETFGATKERAMGSGSEGASLSPEVFAKTMITTKELIPNPRTTESALLRIKPRNADVALPSLEDGRQAIEKKEADGSILLRNRRTVPPPGKTGKRPLASPSAELEDYTTSNAMIQSDAPEIVKIANDVVGNETDAWKAAQKLERWVDDNVTNKNMDVAFASALEVCHNRSGDCSEHSVFLAALCRAAGIPARSVMGLEYLGGIWGGHAWDEVWIDGEWYALDATNGYGFVDPLHLAFSKMSLKDGNFAKEFGNLLAGLGNIDIEVVEIASKGRTLKPSAPDVVKLNGNRYVNRLWGLALDKPEGFTFEPHKPSQEISNELLEIKGKTASGEDCGIEVIAAYVPPQFDWHDLAKRFTGAGATKTADAVVDGRKGETWANDAKKARIVSIVDGDSLWIFESRGLDAKVFDTFLKSVDFDAADAAKN
jgi:transglutaminase superfamily protein